MLSGAHTVRLTSIAVHRSTGRTSPRCGLGCHHIVVLYNRRARSAAGKRHWSRADAFPQGLGISLGMQRADASLPAGAGHLA